MRETVREAEWGRGRGSAWQWVQLGPAPARSLGSSGARITSYSCPNLRHRSWPFSPSYQRDISCGLYLGGGSSSLASPEKGAPMSRRHSPEKRQVRATGSQYLKKVEDGCTGREKGICVGHQQHLARGHRWPSAIHSWGWGLAPSFILFLFSKHLSSTR